MILRRLGGRLWPLLACFLLGAARPAAAAEGAGRAGAAATRRVREVRLLGLEGTKPDTVLDLLPRPAPNDFTPEELVEFERRINNIGVFDSVEVRAVGDELVVAVREKFTLTPSVDFASGKTLRDSYASLGATEYNFLGAAAQLRASLSWEQRGLSGAVSLFQHPFHPTRGALGGFAYFERAGLRFDEGGWFRNQVGAGVRYQLPFLYDTPFRYEFGADAYREAISDSDAPRRPPDGYSAGVYLGARWDRYTSHDLAPRGVRIALEAQPAYFLPSGEARHLLSSQGTFALSFGGRAALVARVVAEAVTYGNANHSVLVGSQRGVRGLADAFYRNRAQAFANVEARLAWKPFERWALQGVAFADAAGFEPMTVGGRPTRWQGAVGAGAGVRVIPTFLTQLLLRVDAARLLAPEPAWFVQLGFNQYF